MNVRTTFLPMAVLLFGACASAPEASQTAAAPAATSVAMPEASTGGALSPSERAAFDRVSVQTIRDVTAALSSREMEGRFTATPGGERAAQWIADRFKAIGLEPAGANGTYFQRVPFITTRARSTSQIRAGSTVLELGTDFVPYLNPSVDSLDVTGGVVFVAYGAAAPALERNDFEGIDVNGKIVVLLAGRPPAADSATWAANASVQRAFGALLSRGARAILLTNTSTPAQPYEVVARYLTRPRVALEQTAAPPTAPTVLFLGPSGAEKLWRAARADYAEAKRRADAGGGASRDLLDRATIALRFDRVRGTGSNVAGVLRGSDPARADEAVLYSAHYDAFGMSPDGQLYAGAADNALGVAMITAVAEAMARTTPRPRRSAVFLAVTGEEHGLLGAEYWAANPTWPLAKIAANINHDGIGTETYGPMENVIGWGGEHSTLGALMTEVVEATGNRVQPDPFPEENVFLRSDHYAFVKAGVPALMVAGAPADTAWPRRAKEWLAGPYHQPGDTIRTDWHWDGPRELAAISLLMGLRIANAEQMPAWLPESRFNKPRRTDSGR